jgi:hypothetical protein
MPQFAVYRNPNPETTADYPLLLDVQSDLIAELGTRVVVPLCPAEATKGKLLRTLTPGLEVAGEQYNNTPCSPRSSREFRCGASTPRSPTSHSVETTAAPPDPLVMTQANAD